MEKHKIKILMILVALAYLVAYINPPPAIGLVCFGAIFVALIVSDGIGKY